MEYKKVWRDLGTNSAFLKEPVILASHTILYNARIINLIRFFILFSILRFFSAKLRKAFKETLLPLC
ncbi:MAG: hypothetical protein ACXAB8_13315 [Promethearchaeota archaeon]